MKKPVFIISSFLLLILIVNFFILGNVNRKHSKYHETTLFTQASKCGQYVENTLSAYENDLTRIIFYNSQRLHLIFSDEETMVDIIASLQNFYKKHRFLLSNIAIYDNSNKYLGLYIKDNDEFVVDTFTRQQKNVIHERQIITDKGTRYLSSFPFYRDNVLVGNIVAEINLQRYLLPIFELFHVEGLQWQWLVNTETGLIIPAAGDSIHMQGLNLVTEQIRNNQEGLISHSYSDGYKDHKLLSGYYHLSVLDNNLGIMFSSDKGKAIHSFASSYRNLFIFNILLIGIILGYFLIIIFRNEERIENLAVDLLSYRMIIEQFPVGVMILDKNGIIKNINLTGQRMLFLDTDEGLIGKSYQDQFLLSNKYLLKEHFNVPFDINHFLFYEKDGNEIIIYRKEVRTHIAGDELTISALIDVSPFEKSRKQEAAANMAKSDFLAKMSHEIRTPMNGIIGMTDSLLRSNLPEDQKDQVNIIKKSSALLMNVINDILDFSKIEAGKMMLEEIPFNLNDEIQLIQKLYKPLVEEKGLSLVTLVKPSVPFKLIGDPFRLRQVLSNLLSNAIKFTEEGKIQLSITLLEKYSNSVVLLFSVEDTGIGIDKELIKKLFGSYEQGGQATSRKYGGTGLGTSIARQLVEMMNGEIWVESPVNTSENPKYPGSKFSFTIEAHSNEKLEKKYDFSSFSNYNQISGIILSKTKDENDRMHTILDTFGINYIYRLYNDKSMDEVLQHIEEKRELYQLIVIKDKPGHDGFAIAKQIKENRLADYFLIIMVSSHDEPGNYLKARSLGIDYYLIQPYESNEVFKILNENFLNIKESKSIYSDINRIRPGLKILVADDNLINQRVVQTIFKHLGYEIDIAPDGAEAVSMAENNNYDIIFMDLLMPEMDGFAATMEIRKFNKSIPVIAMSAADANSAKEDAFDSGMNEYIEKPVKVENIKQLLIKWFSESI